jgi:hypothetical protein
MRTVDNAIKAINNHVLALQYVNIKAAPDVPVENAHILPLAITYITGGTGQADDATSARLLLNINCDVHFDRINLGMTYRQINQCIPEMLQRLAGDPTLGGAVKTIIFPVNVAVQPMEWGKVMTVAVSFTIPLKFLEDPIT